MICSWCDELVDSGEKYHDECIEASKRSSFAPCELWASDFDRLRGEDIFARKARQKIKGVVK